MFENREEYTASEQEDGLSPSSTESCDENKNLTTEQEILHNSQDPLQTTVATAPILINREKRERTQTMPARFVKKENISSASCPSLLLNDSSFLIEKQNDGYYTLDGRQIHTWQSLLGSLHVSHFENDEFQLRDSFQKASSLIAIGNIFEAIATMETIRLEQLWLDKLVEVVKKNMSITKTEEWSEAIMNCPKTMAFLQHFLIQNMRKEKVRLPNSRRYGLKRKETL